MEAPAVRLHQAHLHEKARRWSAGTLLAHTYSASLPSHSRNPCQQQHVCLLYHDHGSLSPTDITPLGRLQELRCHVSVVRDPQARAKAHIASVVGRSAVHGQPTRGLPSGAGICDRCARGGGAAGCLILSLSFGGGPCEAVTAAAGTETATAAARLGSSTAG
jgi:hypothetical protein